MGPHLQSGVCSRQHGSPLPWTPPPPPQDDNQLIAERREKLAAIRRQGVAFPNDFKPKDRAADLIRKHGALPNEELEPQAVKVTVPAGSCSSA
jgi:lysyl-tRNA synthetase class II